MTGVTDTGRATAEPPFLPALVEERLLQDAGDLLQRAHAGGADQAEVFACSAETVSVSFEKGDLKLAGVDEGTTYGLRVFHGGRLGFASTNQGGEAALDAIAADACELARHSPPDEANVLASPPPVETTLNLWSAGLAGLGVAEVVELAQDLVQRTLAVDPRISLDKAGLELRRVSVAARTSEGVRASESDQSCQLSLFGMAIDGDDVGGFDYWGANVREMEQLEAAVAETVERFSANALGNLGAGAAESYRGPVLFSPAAFLDVFLSPLVSAASALAVQRGRSSLAGKLGERVGAEILNVLDDPHDRRLAGAASFDREGVPTRRFPLLEDGLLSGYLYNAYAARVEGLESTGHASGGPRAVPGLGPHALSVAGGSGTGCGEPAELRAALGRGLVVQRFSGSVDPASGDFSGVAKSARWVEGGLEVRPVRETLLAGNAFELLARVVGLSLRPEVVMGVALAPWALVDGVSVTTG